MQVALPQQGELRRLPRVDSWPCKCLKQCAQPKRQRLCGQRLHSSATSLIPETLQDMAADTELQEVLSRQRAVGQAALTREERLKRQRALDKLDAPPFAQVLQGAGCTPLKRDAPRILQLNIGLYCNQACTHCHVESSPKRTEMMDARTAQQCMELLRRSTSITTVDLTGGAPELNAQFRYLVKESRAAGKEVIDRCNLTVLLEPGQEDLPRFLAENNVRVVASLPCYSVKNVDAQRGSGVFDRSIQGLQLLNEVGYGKEGTGLFLDLVYNPGGAFLAPSQSQLQPTYKQELAEHYGIVFNSLLCLNNMPIKRFADYLLRRGQMQEYMQLLVGSFNPDAAEGVMCRDTVSVSWDGRLFDCDFNQQLDMPLTRSSNSSGGGGGGEPVRSSSSSSSSGSGSGSDSSSISSSGSSFQRSAPGLTVFDIDLLEDLTGRRILVDNHCFGCTAGSGSSCQGATA